VQRTFDVRCTWKIARRADATGRLSCGIIAAVDKPEEPDIADGGHVNPVAAGHWIALRGHLAQPFLGWLGGWAAFCGALASNRLHWTGTSLLTLVLVLLLVELAWGSLWDVAVSTDWFRPVTNGRPPARPAMPRTLPYTQPGSPGGRLARRLGRLVGWWKDVFWPSTGPAVLGILAAGILTGVLALLLPDRLAPLYPALLALAGLGVLQRRRARDPLAAQALTRVGLSWLAGHAAFGELGSASLGLALCFSLAAWGDLRVGAGLSRGFWLLNGGQMFGVAVLLFLRQPVAAGIAGLLLFGQIAMQPSLYYGDSSARAAIARWTWPWLMAAMLVAAWALP
jgi:hypothetical protein